MRPKNSIPILDEFFRRGGAGLTDEKRDVWKRSYMEFRERHKHWDVWDYRDESRDDDEPIMLPQTEVMPYQPDN